jgi:hypothetical protein
MVKNRARKKSCWIVLRPIFGLALLTLCDISHSAQFGPFFPTHNFPTDQSFHLNYRFGFHNSNSNFVDTFATDVLADGKSIRRLEHQFNAEYQPNRQFAFGAQFNLDQMKLNSGDAIEGLSKTGFGDQRFFAEFRFYDEPGTSVGIGTAVKFSLYSNPTATELAASADPNNVVLLGDGQLDGSLMLTGEHWPMEVVRLRLDVGMNFRTQGYASEMIYQGSAGFVTPKMDLDLKLKGTLPLGGGGDFADLALVKSAFGGSDYALSANPRQLILNPSLALWLAPKISFNFDFEMSFSGKESANFLGFYFGLGYRWAKTKQGRIKTFQDVDIRKNLDGDRFEAEDGKDKNDQVKPREPVYDEGDIIYE